MKILYSAEYDLSANINTSFSELLTEKEEQKKWKGIFLLY